MIAATRMFLFFAIPVLNGILPMPYFNHLCYLVAAVYIVLSDAIQESDLSNTDRLLKAFYSQCAQLYGKAWLQFKL